MTAIAEVINEALVYIDDVRLNEQLGTNPALFYRKMQSYVNSAMPLLSSPPELYQYIISEYVPAEYDSFEWQSTEESLSQVTAVDTGMIGYEVCSVVILDEVGTEAYPNASYDSETGIVTFPVQSATGVMYEMDFYTDGSFKDLSVYKKRLFGRAIALVWDERFERTWLNIQPKVKDSSFQTVNEANFMRSGADRLKESRQSFEDEMHKYEQLNAYQNINKPYPQRTLL